MGERERLADWQLRLAAFDFEVTAHDWLLVIIEYQTGAEHVFHNDPIGVEDFLDTNDFIYAGFNCKHYDNYILKGVLNRYPPEEIKKINDWIIVDKQDGWTYPFDQPFIKIPPTTDLMLDLPTHPSLKECEGNMLMDIRESTISFDIDHPWTKEEFEEMLFYCKHDVRATIALLKERMDYLESKVSLGELCGLTVEESLYRTNAQLAAKSLGAVKQEHDDYRDYVIPPEVDQSLIPQSILDFIEKFKSVREDELKEDNVKLSWVGDIVGTEHKIGLGGIHAAKKNYFEESNDKRIIVDFDVTSYYPSLLIEYNYLSRNVADRQIYIDYYHARVEAKAKGDKKKAGGLKLVLNTTYGASLQKFNDLYDPLMGVSTCLTGQLLLTQLLVTLDQKLNSFVHIQSNTDGIMFSIDRDELDYARELINQWSKRTRLGMGEIQIKRVIQKDVNNYIIENFDGDIEVRGAYVSDHPKGTFKHNSFGVVATAIVKYFTENIPVEETILACDDPFKFQLIAKTGSTYQRTVQYLNGEEIDVQKVNRVYAVNDEKYGVIKKVKKQYLTLDEDGERRYYINLKGKRTYKKNWETDEGGDFFIKKDTTQNCPDHAYIDNGNTITIDTINKEWYIKLAKKRINDFLGIKETKGGKKMPAAKTVKLEPKPALYKKIFDLGVALAKKPFVADGYNSQQGYEYVRSAYYRKVLGEACREVGLVFKFTLNNRLFTPLEKTKNMNLTTVLGMMCLIDPDTGEHEDYSVIADGSDNLDKGVYKAETMAIKYFVLNNFLLPETQDELDPEDGKQDKQVAKEEEKAVTIVAEEKPKPTPPATPTQRKEAKEEVVNNRTATPEFVQEILEVMDVLRSSNKTDSKGKVYDQNYGQKTYTNLQKCLNGELAMISNTEAVKLMTTFEERLSELGLD